MAILHAYRLQRFTRVRDEAIDISTKSDIQRRISHATTDKTMLTISIVVIGNMNLNPGRSMTTSPGKWNNGTRLTHGQRRPATMNTAPTAMRKRFIASHIIRDRPPDRPASITGNNRRSRT